MNSEIVASITRLRAQLIIASILYYEFDSPIWSDANYDTHIKTLVDLQEKFPIEATEAKYGAGFDDFTGATGYHLPSIHHYMHDKARRILDTHESHQTSQKG